MAGLILPPQGHPVREMFDVADLAVRAAPSNRHALRTLNQAIVAGRKYVAGEPVARSVNLLAVNAAGHLLLITVGSRGGWRTAWDFGALA